jgi:transcriptional regulator with XRE-family HTH domain
MPGSMTGGRAGAAMREGAPAARWSGALRGCPRAEGCRAGEKGQPVRIAGVGVAGGRSDWIWCRERRDRARLGPSTIKSSGSMRPTVIGTRLASQADADRFRKNTMAPTRPLLAVRRYDRTHLSSPKLRTLAALDRLPILDSKRLGRRLREIRQARGYSQPKLAAKSGLPQSNISGWETGRYAEGPTFLEVLKLARALGVDLQQFIDPSAIDLRRLPKAVADAITDHVESISEILDAYQKDQKDRDAKPA